MEKHLFYYTQHSQYSEPTDKPAVSYCELENEVHYHPYTWADEYLTFDILSAGTIVWKANNSAMIKTISYSLDGGNNWNDITSSTAGTSFNVNVGDKVLFKGENTKYADVYASADRYSSFSGSTAYFNVYGNIMSLIGGDNFNNVNTFSTSRIFGHLFTGSHVVSADNLVLPVMSLTTGCYDSMFYGCANLTKAPKLPATTLANGCYDGMFWHCTSLTTVPLLPATTLASHCYYCMFTNCTSLTTAPKLPATTLAQYCYSSMFSGCTNLTTAPVLPATTLANGCYSNMFGGCTSLTIAPELPVTSLADSCYSSMFYGCASLTSAPELSATTLADYCYNSMFCNCTSINQEANVPSSVTPISSLYCTYMYCNCPITTPNGNYDSAAYECQNTGE